MFDRLREIFNSDAFVPASAVFPDIDSRRLAADLALEKKGAKRGGAEQPPSEAGIPDTVEMEAIQAVETLRRKGLENFENNRKVYSERLTRAGEARREIEVEAGKAVTDFRAVVEVWRSELVDAHRRVTDAYHWLLIFRERNRLERPAYHTSGFPMLLGLGALLIVVEAALNSATFAGAHELGLLGGGLMAVLIAAVNVTISSLLGGFFREINHVRWLRKAIGLFLMLLWFAVAVTFNLGVAHFRDAMAGAPSFEAAAQTALATMRADPLGMESMQSWLLFVLGVTVAAGAALKAATAFDPYPGYRRVDATVGAARAHYSGQLQAAIGTIEERRDDAIEALKEAQSTVERNISDAIDALYGQSALASQLEAFLQQCDIKVQALLAAYRDANRAARKTVVPRHFDELWTFPSFTPASPDAQRQVEADEGRREMQATIDHAIQSVIGEYDKAVHAFRSIEALEEKPLPAAPRPSVEPAAAAAAADAPAAGPIDLNSGWRPGPVSDAPSGVAGGRKAPLADAAETPSKPAVARPRTQRSTRAGS